MDRITEMLIEIAMGFHSEGRTQDNAVSCDHMRKTYGKIARMTNAFNKRYAHSTQTLVIDDISTNTLINMQLIDLWNDFSRCAIQSFQDHPAVEGAGVSYYLPPDVQHRLSNILKGIGRALGADVR